MGGVVNVATVNGAILLGTCFGSALSGAVFVQCVLYYKLYPSDHIWKKILVFAIWAFDLMHTICIVSSIWESIIINFNQPANMDDIPISLGLSVAVTAILTFMVHCFFANRIRMLMKRWYIAGPVMFLAFLRLLAACVSTREIIYLKRFSLLVLPYPAWVFTTGLALSASVDVIITTVMCIFLGSQKAGSANTQHIINTMILYTLETSGITCLVTFASLICWLFLRPNLIFMGIYISIAKLYANSLLATLNTRNRLQTNRVYSSERDHPFLMPAASPFNGTRFSTPPSTSKGLNINVRTTVVPQNDAHRYDYELGGKPGMPTLAAIDEE